MEHHFEFRDRRSWRLKGFDYSRAGAYFVTICTQNRAWLFGNSVDGALQLHPAGEMVQQVWDAIPEYYPGIGIDAFIVMPNHIHGIVILKDSHSRRLSLPDVIHRFKTMTTKRYADGVRQLDWAPFRHRLWQRSFHDRIIRDRTAFLRIRTYIRNNPL
ncbi:MAG: transposase [Bacteroidetes bacterium]|nr:transposase [Bacteroidota bacterium]